MACGKRERLPSNILCRGEFRANEIHGPETIKYCNLFLDRHPVIKEFTSSQIDPQAFW